MGKKRNQKTVGDTVCRIHKFGGYAVLSNCFVRSTNLGCPAIGLLGKVMDLPPEWNFTMAGIEAICADGITAIETALADLEEWGYVRKTVQIEFLNSSSSSRHSELFIISIKVSKFLSSGGDIVKIIAIYAVYNSFSAFTQKSSPVGC